MLVFLLTWKKHSKNIHYESIIQFLGRKYQVIITRKDRNQSINAA